MPGRQQQLPPPLGLGGWVAEWLAGCICIVAATPAGLQANTLLNIVALRWCQLIPVVVVVVVVPTFIAFFCSPHFGPKNRANWLAGWLALRPLPSSTLNPVVG